MTREEAQAEARERWGPEAIATYNWQLTYNHEVADRAMMPRFWGVGETWEAAFEDADERQRRRVCTE